MEGKLLFAEHHQSHAASAFYPSPFEEAVVLTMDGVGEWTTASISIGRGRELEMVREIRWPHSLGLLYSAFTYYTGFKVNSGEYKLMGLAPYGEPKYVDPIMNELIDVKPDGSFWLNQRYFNYATGLTMTNARFDDLFGGKPRDPDQLIEQRHMDLAASVQAVTEEVMLRITRELAKAYGIPNLCLAGGVALNCVANGKVLRDGSFENIWIQPAAGDAGGALGQHLPPTTCIWARRASPTALDAMQGAYLGPDYPQKDIEARLKGGRRQIQRPQGRGALRKSRRFTGKRRRGGLVLRAHGVRAQGPGRALDPGRSPQPGNAKDHESADQIPRELSAPSRPR